MNLNAKNAENSLSPSVFVQTPKTKGLAPPAGRMTVKNNCPSFRPADPERVRIWEVLRLPGHAQEEAAFPERVDTCSSVLQLTNIKEHNIYGNNRHRKKR